MEYDKSYPKEGAGVPTPQPDPRKQRYKSMGRSGSYEIEKDY